MKPSIIDLSWLSLSQLSYENAGRAFDLMKWVATQTGITIIAVEQRPKLPVI
jgi:hypothetical protein